MKLYLNEQAITIHPILLKQLGYGTQGKVYKYKGEALKIFKRDIRDLSLEDCDYLKDINTNRILLPNKLLTNSDGMLTGYTTELISKEKLDEVYNLSKDVIVNELYEVSKEIKLLSNNYIFINDWNITNFMYDGMFRFVDSGYYKIDYLHAFEQNKINKYNNEVFNNFVFMELITAKFYQNYETGILTSSMLKAHERRYKELGCNLIGEYIEATMDKNDTFLEYVKKSDRY